MIRPSSPTVEQLALLGFEPGADPSEDEVKASWRQRRKEAHPDMGGDANAFYELTKAHEACLAWAARVRACQTCNGSKKVGIFRCNACGGTGEQR